MGLFSCDHQWKVIAVKYTPPVKRSIEMTGFFNADMIIYGFTSVTQQCQVKYKSHKCGKIDVNTYVGKVDIPGWS